MKTPKQIVAAVMENLENRQGFDAWWEPIQPSIKHMILTDLELVVKSELNPAEPTAKLYQYQHVWYDWNMDSRTTLTSRICNTLEEAVNQVMLTAIEKQLDPPWWWQKPEEK